MKHILLSLLLCPFFLHAQERTLTLSAVSNLCSLSGASAHVTFDMPGRPNTFGTIGLDILRPAEGKIVAPLFAHMMWMKRDLSLRPMLFTGGGYSISDGAGYWEGGTGISTDKITVTASYRLGFADFMEHEGWFLKVGYNFGQFSR